MEVSMKEVEDWLRKRYFMVKREHEEAGRKADGASCFIYKCGELAAYSDMYRRVKNANLSEEKVDE